jgi:hypothetical protein
MARPSFSKIYLLEIKRVRVILGNERSQKKVPKIRSSCSMLLKTHVVKMSVFGPETMLMKTNELGTV